MVTLGLHAFTHDSAAALLVDGRLAAFAQEERLSRRKGDGRFPGRAIRFCLEDAEIDAASVDRVVLPFRPGVGSIRRFAYHLRRPGSGLPAAGKLIGRGLANLGIRGRLQELGINAPLARTDHHLAHARAAFMASGFESAAILVIDGVAEAWSGAAFLARRRPKPVYTCVSRIPFPESLGLIYAAVTEHLGFQHNREEGTVMAMAAAGSGDLIAPMARACRLEEDRLRLDGSLFDFGGRWTTRAFARRFGPPRNPSEEITDRHFALARAVQSLVENVAAAMARQVIRKSGEHRLCLSGGLALNPSLNSAVGRGSEAAEFFLLPIGGDAGTALGGAFAFEADPEWRLEHAFFGSFSTQDAIDQALSDSGLSPVASGPDAAERTARLLAEGAIGACFSGRSELGPRALGHRSILADPRREESRTRLNTVIKQREAFRPFAPAILLKAAPAFFPGLGESPFMLRTWEVAQEFRDRIPAVLHVDGTARPQTVTEDDASGLAEILRTFEKITGLPILLNTSLNRRGEPLAEKPEDAMVIFKETGLDFLLIGHHLALRPGLNT